MGKTGRPTMAVLARHIVWTTYGTWLPGDARGWIEKDRTGIQPPNPQLEWQARQRMAQQPVSLTLRRRALVEQTIRVRYRIRKWLLHSVKVRSNRVHVVVAADRDADGVRKQFKTWCSRKLSDAAGLRYAVARKAGRHRWLTEGGDTKTIEDEAYLEND